MRQFQVEYIDLDARIKHGLCTEETISADDYDLHDGWFRFWIGDDMKTVYQISSHLVRGIRAVESVPTS